MLENFYIKKNDLFTIENSKSKEEAEKIMNNNNFDVLPIIENNSIKSVYVKEDNQMIKIEKISYENIIDESESLIQVIFKLKDEKKYLFVTKESKIIGLIVPALLNGKIMLAWLYNQIIELELKLSMFLKNNFSENDLLNYCKDEKNDCSTIYKYYLKDVQNNFDVSIYEYLTFGNLYNIIKNKKIYTKLNLNELEFNNYKDIVYLRNSVMHTTGGLINHKRTIEKLNQSVLKIKKLNFILENL